MLERHAKIHRFGRGLIRIRNLRKSVLHDHRPTLAELMERVQVQRHGVRLGLPDTGHRSHSLAVTASSLSGDLLMPFALNACWQPLDFGLPTLPAHHRSGWLRKIDTARPSPHDLVELAAAEGGRSAPSTASNSARWW